MSEEIKIGDRFRNGRPLPVTCWWWYDTAAILEDYSDYREAVLPAGQILTVEQIAEREPSRILCRIDHPEKVKNQMIPESRQIRVFLFCSPTPFSVELSIEQLRTECRRIGSTP